MGDSTYLERAQALGSALSSAPWKSLSVLAAILLALSFLWVWTFAAKKWYWKLTPLLLGQAASLALSLQIGSWLVSYPLLFVLPSLLIGWVWYLFSDYSTPDRESKTRVRYRTNKGTKYFDISSHMAIFGSTGSGKTESGFVPILRHICKWKLPAFIFDYKEGELLEKFLPFYNFYKKEHLKEKAEGKESKPLPELKIINLPKPNFSNHFNPFNAQYISTIEEVEAISQTFFDNLYPGAKEGDFFKMAGSAGFAGTIQRFKEDFPHYCDFPHIAAMCLLTDGYQLAEFIEKSDRARILAAPYLDGKGNSKQMASMKSSLTSAIKRVATPNIFMVLSKEDAKAEINKPGEEGILAVVNDPTMDSVYLPVYSLITRIVADKVSRRDREFTYLVLDEGSALKIDRFDRMLATLRTFKILVIWGLQDRVQGEIMYGDKMLRSIFNNLVTRFLGRAGDPETATFYTRLFESQEKEEKSFTSGDGRTSVSRRKVEKKKYTEYQFQKRKRGQFYVFDIDGKDYDLRMKQTPYQKETLPQLNFYSDAEIQSNFEKVLREVKELIEQECPPVEEESPY